MSAGILVKVFYSVGRICINLITYRILKDIARLGRNTLGIPNYFYCLHSQAMQSHFWEGSGQSEACESTKEKSQQIPCENIM